MRPHVTLGEFGRCHGVRGWVRVHASTDPIAAILDYQPWWVAYRDTTAEPLTITDHRLDPRGLLVKLAEFDDREAVKVLTLKHITVPAEQLPALPEDQYYWHQLVGLQVYTRSGEHLGYIDHMLPTGSNDVFVIHTNTTPASEHLIPYLDHAVLEINLQQQRMVVDWPLD